MNIAANLPKPLSDFVVDVPKDTYYDFKLAPDSTYPLKGVTYPVDYGNIPGYTAEDGHELDLFVGSDSKGKAGYVIVDRGEHISNEKKFFIGLTPSDLEAVLSELQPVLIGSKEVGTVTELLNMIEEYEDKA